MEPNNRVERVSCNLSSRPIHTYAVSLEGIKKCEITSDSHLSGYLVRVRSQSARVEGPREGVGKQGD